MSCLEKKYWFRDSVGAPYFARACRCLCVLSEYRTFDCFVLGISKIEYKPDGGPGDNLCFKHYNAQEVTILDRINLT